MGVVSDCGPLTAPGHDYSCDLGQISSPQCLGFLIRTMGYSSFFLKELLGELNEMMRLVPVSHSIMFPLPLMM